MLRTQRQTRIAIGGLYFLLGAAALWALVETQSFPPIRLFVLFSVTLAVLEWKTVSVNDALAVSSGVMVTLTAGIVFALEGSGAALGMAAMSALGVLTPGDVRGRRFFQPAVNFGQMVTTAALAGLVIDASLGRISGSPGFLLIAVITAAAAAAYLALNLGQVHLIVRVAYRRRDLRPWSGMTTLLPSYLALGIIGGLMGATFMQVGNAMLPLMLALFVAGHFAFASYGELREAHEATLRGFVKALEAKDLYTRGHTERVAYFSRLIGEELGYRGTRLQRLRWAALIHDVGKLAVPSDLIRKKGRLSEQEYESMQSHAGVVEDLLAEVEFLRPMVEIASGHHSHYNGAGYGGSGHTHGVRPSPEARILAVADAFDAMTSTRSYRTAMSQSYAFGELRQHAGSQFDPQMVVALQRALERTSERYGSPEIDSEQAARRLAEEGVSPHG